MLQYISVRSKIGIDVTIGNFTSIFEDVLVGKNSWIGNNVTIHRETIIGENCTIGDNAVIGKPDETLLSSRENQPEKKPTKIGDNCIIGTNAIIYRGVTVEKNSKVPDLSILR